MNNQEPKKTNNLGYRLGQAFAVLIFACTSSICIALTIRIILRILRIA